MNLTDKIPPFLADNDLKKALSKSPHYDRNAHMSKEERLVKLLDIFDLFVPTKMSVEIYNTLYFAMVRSINRKNNLLQSQTLNNRKIMNGASIIGGVNGGDCSLIIGNSGVGKSNSISRAIEATTKNETIELEAPYCSIIPFLCVEAPNVSIKGFFYEILRSIDNRIGTNYYKANHRDTVNTDTLLGATAQALTLHSIVVVIDECDRLLNSKSNTVIGYITELINLCGVSVIFCGTTKCLEFFQSTEYLCRRGMGNIYYPMEYGEEYYKFCQELLQYQYTVGKVELNSDILRKMYQLTNGNTTLTVNLFVEAQRKAITEGFDKIDTNIITQAFQERMSIMTPYIEVKKTNLPPPHYKEDLAISTPNNIIIEEDNIFTTLPPKSEKDIDKAIEILKQSITVEVIQI